LGPVVVDTRTDRGGTDTDTDTTARISSAMDGSAMDGSGMDAAGAGTSGAATAACECFSGNTRNANDGRCGKRSDCSIGHTKSFLVSGVKGQFPSPVVRMH
jgi:hypothetical protein